MARICSDFVHMIIYINKKIMPFILNFGCRALFMRNMTVELRRKNTLYWHVVFLYCSTFAFSLAISLSSHLYSETLNHGNVSKDRLLGLLPWYAK